MADIIGRKEFQPDDLGSISEFFTNKKILITGGAGSIGSAIIRVLHSLGHNDFLAVDRDENALHSLQLEIGGSALFQDRRIALCDIRDFEACIELVEKFNPDVVIHAAALKHLSALEIFPREAVLTNILGTKNMVLASNMNSTPIFVNVSTDKAANPTSVLGKTKRIAELIVTNYSSAQNSISVRFGNIFASKGSVIETFVYQLQNDLEVTLTDESVERYFMSDREAAFLVLQSVMLESKGLYILEMGHPIRLIQIIKNLSSKLGRTSNIRITGLRPGEKIKETLVNNSEKIVPTKYQRILKIEESSHTDTQEFEKTICDICWNSFEISKAIKTHEKASSFLKSEVS